MARYLTVKQLVDEWLKLTDWGDTFPDHTSGPKITDVEDWLREGEMKAMEELPQFRRTTATITTVSGTPNYDDITDAWDLQFHGAQILDSSSNTDKLLEYADYDFLKRQYTLFESSAHKGKPRYYTVNPRTEEVIFWPTPDAVYSIRVEYDAVPSFFAMPEYVIWFLADPLDGSTYRKFTRGPDVDRKRDIALGATYPNSGDWNASTNSPTLADSTGTDGTYYTVSVAGTQNTAGLFGSVSTTLSVGDLVHHNGSEWEQIAGGALVTIQGYIEENFLADPETVTLDGQTVVRTTGKYYKLDTVTVGTVDNHKIFCGLGQNIEDINIDSGGSGIPVVTQGYMPQQWAQRIGPYYAAAKWFESKGDTEASSIFMTDFRMNLEAMKKRFRDPPQSKVYFFGHGRGNRIMSGKRGYY